MRTRGTFGELAAARAIRHDLAAGVTAGQRMPCVVGGDSYTQLEWYTGCAAEGFAGYDPLVRGDPFYSVIMPEEGTPRWVGRPDEKHIVVLLIPGIVTVTRVTR